MSPTWPKAVIFDLDGTLVDSAPDIATSINDVLRDDGFAEFSLPEVVGFIGHGITRLVDRAYATRGRKLEGQALTDKVATFQAVYQDRIAERSRPYPGAIEAVEAFRAMGIRTGICTNKAEPLMLGLLKGLDMDGLFDAAVGGSKGFAAKPAADMLVETMRRLGVGAGDSVMIGDSETDVATARAAGIPVVGVSFGYTDVPMRELGADAVIDDFAEAAAAVAGLRAEAGR